jgi:hypothetical protein
MQGLRVRALASQPGGESGMPVAEDSLGGGRIQSTGSRRQHHPDLLRGGFQAVQGGVAPRTERRVASLTAKGLDPLGMAMSAIANQGMNVSVCDAEVRALVVGAGEALGVHPFRCSPSAFDLAPGADRRRCWLHTRREGGGEATGGAIAWGAWFKEALDFGVHL